MSFTLIPRASGLSYMYGNFCEKFNQVNQILNKHKIMVHVMKTFFDPFTAFC